MTTVNKFEKDGTKKVSKVENNMSKAWGSQKKKFGQTINNIGALFKNAFNKCKGFFKKN